jgi:hypothetical protein
MSNDLDQDIARLWADAVARFEARTKTSVSALGSITSIEQLIASLAYKKTIFTKRRRNGSKIERIRTLASKALLPISAISDVLSQATKLVSKQPSQGMSFRISAESNRHIHQLRRFSALCAI